MAFQEKQLGQSRPATTDAVSVYSPDAGATGIVKSIVVCNSSTGSSDFSIFVDDDGTTYDRNTALYFDVPIGSNSTILIDSFFPMNNSNGNISVKTSSPNALTFTIFGAEVS